MREKKIDIEQLFTSSDELPNVVLERKREAYNKIYTNAPSVKSNSPAKRHKDILSFRKWRRPKAAVAFIAALLMTGGTLYAAAGLFTRWDRMKNMDQDTVEQYYEEMQSSGNLSYLTSRDFTERELERYLELKEEYENNLRFPEYEITRLAEGKSYDGAGVCLQITKAGEEHSLYLPDTELTDEELLEIIEYQAKQDYSFYETRRLQALEKGNYESRLAAMTDEEIDYYYLAFWTCVTDTSDGYRRENTDREMEPTTLTDAESARYQSLLAKYEGENLFPKGELTVIDSPEDYSGKGVALCRYDANFYLPNEELTDEELLEIIDCRKKAQYAHSRITEEIRLGYRNQYPSLPDEKASVMEIPFMPFAETEGKGTISGISDAQIGDIVYFGSYEQDNLSDNGKEEIAWYVLNKTDDAMTLLSVNILDGRPYSSTLSYTTWEDSDLRKWLNDDFYKNAFSDAERTQIVSTSSENNDGQNTEDYVYLLSFQEFLSYFGVDITELDALDTSTTENADLKSLHCHEVLDSRIYADVTNAAHANGLWTWTEENTNFYKEFTKLDFSCANGKGSWWLRTSSVNDSAHTIEAKGEINATQYVNGIYGVRPVIQIQN